MTNEKAVSLPVGRHVAAIVAPRAHDVLFDARAAPPRTGAAAAGSGSRRAIAALVFGRRRRRGLGLERAARTAGRRRATLDGRGRDHHAARLRDQLPFAQLLFGQKPRECVRLVVELLQAARELGLVVLQGRRQMKKTIEEKTEIGCWESAFDT